MARPLRYRIPGIRRILLLDSSHLPPFLLCRAGVDEPVLISANAQEVPFVGVPLCEVEETHTKSGVKFKSTITFEGQDVELPPNGASWIVYDQEGQATLFGQLESPSPKYEVKKSTGEFSKRSGATYKITCITDPVPCVYIGKYI